jgi:hypothetical protein
LEFFLPSFKWRCIKSYLFGFKSFFKKLHHIHKKNFNIFFTNLHPISLQLNLKPIVELNFKILFNAEFNLIKFKFNSSCIAMLFISQLHIGMNYIFHLKSIWKFFLIHKGICYFLVFFYVFSPCAKRKIYCMLHIATFHYYLLTKIHLYHVNMSCHWHMDICCLIRFHVNMLTKVVQEIINKNVDANAKG